MNIARRSKSTISLSTVEMSVPKVLDGILKDMNKKLITGIAVVVAVAAAFVLFDYFY